MHTHSRHHDAHVPDPRLRSFVLARPRLEATAGDESARVRTYRRFLRRTQDVGVAGRGYPGGIATLIRDREIVTDLLVGLLQRAAGD